MTPRTHPRLIAPILALAVCTTAPGEDGPAPIRDNSFLIEEAYNQEQGVVQHISSVVRNHEGGAWGYQFTQEWPLGGERHQLSYSIPVLDPGDGSSAGAGDLMLNYRTQAIGGAGRAAFAPRLSLILPTGDRVAGRGAGSAGVQFNLPLSVELGRSLVSHTNLGGSVFPAARNVLGEAARTTSLFAGEGLIWLISSRFNLMLEGIWIRSEEVAGDGSAVRRREAFLSPGVRLAINRPTGLQIVPGVALPIGVGPSHGDRALLLYLSFEHPFGGTAAARAGRTE